MSKTVVITGANRGIGLGMTKCFLERGHRVIATARNPDQAEELQALAEDHSGKCEITTLDVASDVSVQGFGALIENQGALDILINNAGVMGQGGATFGECSLDQIRDTFNVNTLGPMRVTRALLPAIKKSKQPVVAHITSKMGSIADNTGGGYYGYRISKAALNMFNMSFARDFEQITSIVLHPGWVQTDMGGKQAPTTVNESAEGLADVILGIKPEQTGQFLDFKGQTIPF